MKTRPAAPRGTALSPTDTPPSRSPDSLGQVVSMGDATSAPARGGPQQAVHPDVRKLYQKAEPVMTYTGEDRRKNDRRKSALTTTLDTRKPGIDRRKAGRISLKV